MESFLYKIQQNSSIAIFSTTLVAKYLFNTIKDKRPDINVECFIDSFKTGKFQDIKILSPQEAAKNNKINLFIVASISHAISMESLLKELGVNNILILTETAAQAINNSIAQDAGRAFSKNSISERYPSGHYYSAVPSALDIEETLCQKESDEKKLSFSAIELNLAKQLENLTEFENLSNKLKFSFDKTQEDLYYLNNIWFHPYDAYVLSGIINKYKPSKIIEIGSGFSTGLMLDINRKNFNNQIKITCIEPNPERLKEVISSRINDINIYEKRLQDIDLSIFDELEQNDLLFIDSSHVVKMNSDVIKIFFEILPKLNKNVIIHFHDIFNNFSYPKEWIVQRRCWNEAYLLRAFLMYNNNFKIEFFSDFIRAYLKENNKTSKLPIEKGSGSIYLRKI